MEPNTVSAANFLAKNWDKISRIYKSADEALKINIKSAYSTYLTRAAEKHSKGKSFFIRQPTDIYKYYVPISLQYQAKEIEAPDIQKCVSHSRTLVISGSGGSGKSVLLKHLFLDCINSGLYVPILLELRDLNQQSITLKDFISETLEAYGFRIDGGLVESSKKNGTFCFFLDGYDEVIHSKRTKLSREIKQLSNKYPSCPVIISSRPDNTLSGMDEFMTLSVAPLNLKQAQELVKKLEFDDDIKNNFSKDLEATLFEKHKSFLSNPLLLSIMLLTYGEYATIPNKLSVFYNQAFEALFIKHDSYKGGYSRDFLTKLDILDFSRIFSIFSLQTYDKQVFSASRTDCLKYFAKAQESTRLQFSPEDILSDSLNAVCMLIEDGLEVAFTHRSFQEYFVALYISSAAPDVQQRLVDRYWNRMRSDVVIQLLHEINPELVERTLIIPALDRMIKKIGIKNKAGITHAVKIFKTYYKALTISKDRIAATCNSMNADEMDVVHFAVQNYGKFVLATSDEYQNQTKTLIEKYCPTTKNIRYERSELNMRNQCLKDLLAGKGGFSVVYYNAAITVWRALKEKHDRRLDRLDDLLTLK
ncbi:NACHT domain-containing NTPase [Pseudomonas sp. 382]|uniref:NACHT domain-containing protein n=1 Tax=Pseudomonas sp. 382 TaxID=1751969 RepID=UPI000C1A28D9|nr:NACHT domain-containing protein [Pseudomonas sp. 382]PIK78329.1 hypothetical protein CQW31_13170 [Pseudomonas sp. 382]